MDEDTQVGLFCANGANRCAITEKEAKYFVSWHKRATQRTEDTVWSVKFQGIMVEEVIRVGMGGEGQMRVVHQPKTEVIDEHNVWQWRPYF